jgi:hypothetical protein
VSARQRRKEPAAAATPVPPQTPAQAELARALALPAFDARKLSPAARALFAASLAQR